MSIPEKRSCPECGTPAETYDKTTIPWKLKAWTCEEGHAFAWQMTCCATIKVPGIFSKQAGYKVARKKAIENGTYLNAANNLVRTKRARAAKAAATRQRKANRSKSE